MSMRAFASSMLAAVVLAGGCSTEGPGATPTSTAGGPAQVVLALSSVPADVQCIRVIVTGEETVTRTFDVVPGAPTTLSLNGLPLGQATLTETTYDALCMDVTPNTAATWISQMPVTLSLASGSTTMASVVLRRPGMATVTNDFQDGTLALTISPTSVSFPGTVIGGTTTPQSITVTNSGGVASGPLSVTLTGSADFSMSSNTCATSLQPAQTCKVTLVFQPAGSPGARSGQLTVSAGGLSVSAALSGNALALPLTITPSTFTFPAMIAGTSGPAFSFVVKNTGSTSSGTLSTTLSTGASDYTFGTNGCIGVNLAAGNSCTVQLAFNPVVPGARPGVLTVAGSTSVSATLNGTGLSPIAWTNKDLGNATGGHFSLSNNSLDVTGGGTDVWSKADNFQFVFESVTGDATITAKLTSVQNVNTWTKAMLMMREGTGVGARYVAALGTPTVANQYRAQVRRTTNDVTESFFTGAGTLPVWLRVVRRTDNFTAQFSTDGLTWQLIRSDTLTSATSTMQVGVGVTGHTSTNTLATAHFDFVTVTQP